MGGGGKLPSVCGNGRSTQALGLMTNRYRNYVAFNAFLLVTPAVFAADALRVEIPDLAKSRDFIGKSVITHGCLVHSPHGSFIALCDKDDWSLGSVPIQDSESKGRIAFKQLGVDFTHYIEGDFSGSMVELDVDWPQPGKRVFLKLESISGIAPYKP